MILDSLIGFITRYLNGLFGWATRYYWTPARIEDRIRTQLRGDHESLTLTGGELPGFRGFVKIDNTLPFPIVIEVISGSVALSSDVARFSQSFFKAVPARGSDTLLVEGDLTLSQMNYVERRLEAGESDAELRVQLVIACKAGRFGLTYRPLGVRDPSFVNFGI